MSDWKCFLIRAAKAVEAVLKAETETEMKWKKTLYFFCSGGYNEEMKPQIDFSKIQMNR